MKNYFGSLLISFCLLFPVLSLADSGLPLRWAADTESGYPFVFHDPQNQSTLMGFEYEIVSEISKKLNRPLSFVENAWEGLIPGLQRDQYDIVINGVEITPNREKEILFSRPYFLTYEQLVVRREENAIHDLKSCQGKKVGTLRASIAERILLAEPSIATRSYESESNAFEDLRNQRLDAVLLDAPIAQYYAEPDPQLKLVGAPIGELIYGIGMRKSDLQLKQQIDTALKELEAEGRLREIYMRWKLWNPTLAKYFHDFAPSNVQPTQYDYVISGLSTSRDIIQKLKLYYSMLPVLAEGALVTLQISVVAMILAILLGLLLTLAQLYGPKPLSYLAVAYIEVMRGTPLLIQLFFIYYAFPHIGIKLSPWVAAVLGLGCNYASNEAENYRAGIQGVPKAQSEAALALGMTSSQAMRHVVFPQAFRMVLPPITNDFIALLKDSSLVSVITMVELTKLYGQLASTYYDYIGFGILVALFYLLLGLPFVRLARRLERKLRTSPSAMYSQG